MFPKFSLSALPAIALALAMLAAGAGSATAAPLTVGSLEVDGLWTQAVPPGAPTATAYATIRNRGTVPDRLIAVSSSSADHGELHQMSMQGGIMQMRPLTNPIDIPAGGTLVLAPNGVHMMLVGLKERPTAGGKFPVRLTFEKAGSLDTFLDVVPIGGKGPPG